MIARKWLDGVSDMTGEKVLVADGFDDCILGIAKRVGQPLIVIYDTEACVDLLVRRDGMTEDEALEYFQFNVEQAWVGEGTPCFLVRPSAKGMKTGGRRVKRGQRA